MRLTPRTYIQHMHDLGLFTADNPVPELNSRVWTHYLDLYDHHIGASDGIEIIAATKGCGVYWDPLTDMGGYTWALLGPISHPVLPLTQDALVAAVEELNTLCGDKPIMTETFVPADGCTENVRFAWASSPRARIHDKFEDYVMSLSGKRRKQMNRLYRDYATPDFQFDFSSHGADAAELDFIIRHTQARWGKDEAPYALVQVLFPLAAAKIVPSAVRFMRVYHKGELVFFNSYIVRGDVMTSQSTTRSDAVFFSGLGVMIDFKAIEMLAGDPVIRYLDPTCRTGVHDPEQIEVAKREIINDNCIKPFLAAGSAHQIAEFSDPPPAIPYFDGRKGWQLPCVAEILGKSV